MGRVAVAPTLARLWISSSSPPHPSPSVLPPRDWGMEWGRGQGSRSEIVGGEGRLHRESVPRPGGIHARTRRDPGKQACIVGEIHGWVPCVDTVRWSTGGGRGDVGRRAGIHDTFHRRRGGGMHRGRDPWVGSMHGHGEVEHRRRERRCGEEGRDPRHLPSVARGPSIRAAQAEPCTTQICGRLHSTLKE
jgi:hypothetical protein